MGKLEPELMLAAESYHALRNFFDGKMDRNDRKATGLMLEVVAEQRMEKSSR